MSETETLSKPENSSNHKTIVNGVINGLADFVQPIEKSKNANVTKDILQNISIENRIHLSTTNVPVDISSTTTTTTTKTTAVGAAATTRNIDENPHNDCNTNNLNVINDGTDHLKKDDIPREIVIKNGKNEFTDKINTNNLQTSHNKLLQNQSINENILEINEDDDDDDGSNNKNANNGNADDDGRRSGGGGDASDDVEEINAECENPPKRISNLNHSDDILDNANVILDDDDDDDIDDDEDQEEDDEENDSENVEDEDEDRSNDSDIVQTNQLVVNNKKNDPLYKNNKYDETGQDSNDCELLPDGTEEIHSISDSDEETEDREDSNHKTNETDSLQDKGNTTSNITKNNITVMNDKPLSIHSDSDEDGDDGDEDDDEDENELESDGVIKSTVNNVGANTNSDVQEVLSDKEDCVVIEDDKKNENDDGDNNDKDQGLSTQEQDLLSPRRSSRNRKSVVKVRDFTDFDDDIEEVIDDQDPLQTQQPSAKRMKTSPAIGLIQQQQQQQHQSAMMQIAINDARSLATPDPLSRQSTNSVSYQQQFLQQNASKKEPTLVLIDTNSILSRNSTNSMQTSQPKYNSILPMSVPAQGMYSSNMRAASITPIMQTQTMPKPMTQHNNHHQQQQQQQQQQPSLASISLANTNTLLPALTDDMFVLEAPSFIVPYIYEKPPYNNLKEIVDKLAIEIEELRKKLKEEAEDTKDDDEKPGEGEEQNEQKKDSETTTKSTTTKSTSSKRKKQHMKSGDESWDEYDTSTDEEASDDEQKTKVLIKEVQEDLEAIKPHIITPESLIKSVTTTSSAATTSPVIAGSSTASSTLSSNITATNNLAVAMEQKKPENYFDSPLGKFFMEIGINLVQEHVQTDLLRQQKKKLIKEGTKPSPSIQMAITSLMKNLELSKIRNDVFKFETKRCEFCNFKTESALTMAHHYETPHMHQLLYKCNFCTFEIRPPFDILFHMEAIHNIKGRLEKAPAYHQCPNCLFEDNGRSKLARHTLVCGKKFRPEINLTPPLDWEPPAKIPRIKPRHGLVGTATAYQAMAAQAQRAATAAAIIQRQQLANAALIRSRARPQVQMPVKPIASNSILRTNNNILGGVGSIGGGGGGGAMRSQPVPTGLIIANNFHMNNNTAQFIQVPGGSGMSTLIPNSHNQYTMQGPGPKSSKNISQQPSISITPLPRQMNNTTSMIQSTSSALRIPSGNSATSITSVKPGGQNNKQFVICEICDGYIKDLDQLRNHMQWMHKVKIHPKMIYNRPPLNCQKCQYRFFTDQGLERHLLGSHGLVTSSMQDAANKGKDAGRCPVCGKMYQWKLLNHVSRDHNMTLKPAHLSYKCTVCTATFGMYKQFENHVYSAHSTVAKKNVDGSSSNNNSSSSSKKSSSSSSSTTTMSMINNNSNSNSNVHHRSSNYSNHNHNSDSLLKPLKINDEITIIPQPITNRSSKMEIESHIID